MTLKQKQKQLSLWSKGTVTSAQHSVENWCRTGVPGRSFVTHSDAAQFHCNSSDGLPACSKLGSKALEHDSHRNQAKISCFPYGSKKKLSHMFYILTSAIRSTKEVELWHPAVRVPDTGWDDQHCLELFFSHSPLIFSALPPTVFSSQYLCIPVSFPPPCNFCFSDFVKISTAYFF